MQSFLAILLVGGVLVARAETEQKYLGKTARNIRRQFMSCEETYGESWVPCGSEGSRFCYNPELGQSCCDIDSGYCDAGTHCAPVAGHCCSDDEDLASCARNAGFELLTGAVTSPISESRVPVSVQRPFRVGGFSNSTTLFTNSSFVGGETQSTTGAYSPHIQVSVARKDSGTLAWMSAGIVAVGLFMFSC